MQLNSINDMFGNPYSYLSFFEQQQAFKISEPIGNITSIGAYFYQDGNFKDLLKYIHKMQRNVMKNPLRDALCFGINS